MSVQQHGRTVKSIRGKLYFYRGTVLLMVIERNPQSEQAAKDYLASGVINYQGIIYA